MIGRCIWCDRPVPPPRKPPLPEGFCGGPCHACYRAACADVGLELHRHGAISIENLRQRFHDLVLRRYHRDEAAAADDAPATNVAPRPGPPLIDETHFLAFLLGAGIIALGLRGLGVI